MADTPDIRRDHVKTRSHQWRELMAPGIGQFRHAVAQDYGPALHPIRRHRFIHRQFNAIHGNKMGPVEIRHGSSPAAVVFIGLIHMGFWRGIPGGAHPAQTTLAFIGIHRILYDPLFTIQIQVHRVAQQKQRREDQCHLISPGKSPLSPARGADWASPMQNIWPGKAVTSSSTIWAAAPLATTANPARKWLKKP